MTFDQLKGAACVQLDIKPGLADTDISGGSTVRVSSPPKLLPNLCSRWK